MLLTHPPSSTHVTIPFTTPTTPRTRFEDRVCVHGCWRQGRYTCRGCARDSGQTTVLIDTIWLGERASECVVGLTGYLTGHVMIDLAAMTEHWWFEITVTEQTADPTVVGSSSSVFLCMYVCCLLVWLWLCWVYSIFFIKKRWIVISRRVFDSDCIQSCLYSTSLFVNTTNNCVIKKEKKIPFHNTNRHRLGALQIPNILSFSCRVSRSLTWSTLFSEVILHRIHHVIIGQIFSNHTQRQETFSCHKPVTLLLVSNQTGYMSKSRAPADVRCHSLYPLLFLFLSPLFLGKNTMNSCFVLRKMRVRRMRA